MESILPLSIVITTVLVSERKQEVNGREIQVRKILPTINDFTDGKGPPAKECGPPLKARRDAETDSSLAPPEET